MKTIAIQIGNTDDKLTQDEWASFVGTVTALLEDSHASIHFFGAPPNWERWQNAAWIFEIPDVDRDYMRRSMRSIGTAFRQESIAWTEGETEFI